jgi:hypothetical protein
MAQNIEEGAVYIGRVMTAQCVGSFSMFDGIFVVQSRHDGTRREATRHQIWSNTVSRFAVHHDVSLAKFRAEQEHLAPSEVAVGPSRHDQSSCGRWMT